MTVCVELAMQLFKKMIFILSRVDDSLFLVRDQPASEDWDLQKPLLPLFSNVDWTSLSNFRLLWRSLLLGCLTVFPTTATNWMLSISSLLFILSPSLSWYFIVGREGVGGSGQSSLMYISIKVYYIFYLKIHPVEYTRMNVSFLCWGSSSSGRFKLSISNVSQNSNDVVGH